MRGKDTLDFGQERAQQLVIACQSGHITLSLRSLGEHLTIPTGLFGFGVAERSRLPVLDEEGGHLERARLLTRQQRLAQQSRQLLGLMKRRLVDGVMRCALVKTGTGHVALPPLLVASHGAAFVMALPGVSY